MARWQPFDVVGGAYSDDTRPWSVQDTVNYLVVKAERPGARSSAILRGVPGLVTFSAEMTAPIRGLHNAEGRLFAVSGTTLYQIGTDGAATALGTIPGVGRCVFAHNQISGGNQVVIGNGQSGYVWDTAAATLTQIADEGFPGFRSVDFADQYIIGVEPFGRYWFHSDLADATSYNTLDQSEAEKAPDRILQAIATGADVLALGERTGQFFYNTGEATGTWANRPGAEMDVGAASPWTACRLDNTVYWLGHDGSVYRLAGYQPQRVSTHALEQAISRSSMADAFAFTFEDRGHKCYLLTLPDGQTWCFDAATQEWTRRESYGLTRWRASALVKWNGAWIAGDYADGRLYQLDWAVQREADDPLERRRVTGVLHDDQNRMILNGLELVFDTGMDEDSPPLPQPILAPLAISGDVPDGAVGDAVSGAYTVTGGVLPHGPVSVLSGTFPPGLTLNTDGSYGGNYTTQGSYSWTVGGVDAFGSPFSASDTATVAQALWFAVGGLAAGYGIKSPDGLDWVETQDPNLNGVMIFSGGGKLIRTRNSQTTLYSADRGATWADVTNGGNSFGSGRYINGVYFMAHSGGLIRRSLDGITFASVALAANSGSQQAGFVGLTGIVLTAGVGGQVGTGCRSLDGGVTWVDAVNPLGSNMNDVWALASNGTTLAMAFGDDNLMRKTSDGLTWTAMTSPFAGTAIITRAAYGVIGGVEYWVCANTAGQIGFSTNNGASWMLAADTVGAAVTSIEIAYGQMLISGGTNLKRSVNGNNWTPLSHNFGGQDIYWVTAYRP